MSETERRHLWTTNALSCRIDENATICAMRKLEDTHTWWLKSVKLLNKIFHGRSSSVGPGSALYREKEKERIFYILTRIFLKGNRARRYRNVCRGNVVHGDRARRKKCKISTRFSKYVWIAHKVNDSKAWFHIMISYWRDKINFKLWKTYFLSFLFV